MIEKKNNVFDSYVKAALSNIQAWNKKVKQKKYFINKNDSYPNKLIKIYRYANENETEAEIRIKEY